MIGGSLGSAMRLVTRCQKLSRAEAAKPAEGSIAAASACCVVRSPETWGTYPLPTRGSPKV